MSRTAFVHLAARTGRVKLNRARSYSQRYTAHRISMKCSLNDISSPSSPYQLWAWVSADPYHLRAGPDGGVTTPHLWADLCQSKHSKQVISFTIWRFSHIHLPPQGVMMLELWQHGGNVNHGNLMAKLWQDGTKFRAAFRQIRF